MYMNKFIIITISFAITPICFGEDLRRAKNLNRDSKEKAVYSTNIDFDSTIIDGQTKAPTGFFLQGRNRQSLSNMVKLRSSFKNRLKNSRSAIKAMVR